MRIDLFEFIEGFFNGVIYFVYNAIETTTRIIRHPFRGPVYLQNRQSRTKTRQISATTYLFLLYFLLFALNSAGTGGSVLTVAGRAFLTGEIEGDAFWSATLSALIAVVVTDAAIRLFLRWRMAGRPLRAEVTLSAVEYSFLAPIGGFYVVLIAAALSSDTGEAPSSELPLIGLMTICLVAAAPPAALLCAGLKPVQGAGRPKLRWLRWLLAGAAVWLLTIASIVSGLLPSYLRRLDMQGLSAEEAQVMAAKVREEYRRRLLLIEDACYLAGAESYLSALFQSDDDAPFYFRRAEFEVFVTNVDRSDDIRFTIKSDWADPILIRPGEAISVRFELTPPDGYVAVANDSCDLRPSQLAAGKGELVVDR